MKTVFNLASHWL